MRFASRADQQLEAVLERQHIGVDVLVQFECVGDDLDAPGSLGSAGAHLEADPEVAGVLGHAAEGVHGT